LRSRDLAHFKSLLGLLLIFRRVAVAVLFGTATTLPRSLLQRSYGAARCSFVLHLCFASPHCSAEAAAAPLTSLLC
jgi:hypothetical protein